MKRILLYESYVKNNYILLRALQESFGSTNVNFIDAKDIIHNNVLSDKTVAAIVIPGGEDLFYAEKLNGIGNQLIKEYVANGGIYVGICAGSYYGCSRLEWAKTESPEEQIVEHRELVFFQGVSRGPIYDFLEDHDFNKQHQNAVAVNTPVIDNGKITYIKYSGGPIFVPDNPNDPNLTVISTYSQLEGNPIAIVQSRYEKGFALLISPHVEDSGDFCLRKIYRHKNTNYDRILRISNELVKHEYGRKKLWDYLMSKIKNHS
jgi:glutamine amidotransferase-like uncharacterized protein